MAKFEKGEVVVLKSGGPDMTTGFTDNGYVECYWFDGNKPNMKNFHEDTLELSED